MKHFFTLLPKMTLLLGLLTFSHQINYAKNSAIEVGSEAPCLTLTTIQTNGQKVEQCIRTRKEKRQFVILDFFSTTCGACIRNLPMTMRLNEELQSEATTRMVALDKKIQRVDRFLETYPELNISIALDNKRVAKKAFGVYATPTLFVLDPENMIVYKHIGTLKDQHIDEIKEIINSYTDHE